MDQTTTLFRARVPLQRLKRAEAVLSRLGLKPGDAFNMLLAQIDLRKEIPFPISTKPTAPLLTADQQAKAWTEALGEY